MSAGARGAAGSAYVRARLCEIERNRLVVMQSDMDELARDLIRDIDIARLLHEHLYRIGHPLVRSP